MFPLERQFDIGTMLIADVDMTIIDDGHSELSGENLAAIVEVLKRKIPLLLISGSPYDEIYCGLTTNGSNATARDAPASKRRLRETEFRRKSAFFKNLYVSGRGVVAFDLTGNEIRVLDRTDKDIDPSLLSLIFRACLCGFYAVKKNLSTENTAGSPIEKIWYCSGSDEEAATLTRQQLQKRIAYGRGPARKMGVRQRARVRVPWNARVGADDRDVGPRNSASKRNSAFFRFLLGRRR